jgi:hypothetical protein
MLSTSVIGRVAMSAGATWARNPTAHRIASFARAS